MNDELLYSKYYYTPSYSSALGGIKPMKSKLAREHSKVIAKNVRQWIEGQDSYTLHRPVRTRFPRRKTIVSGMQEQVQVDLIDTQAYKDLNDGYRYILTMIDVFSKKGWAVPVKSKSGAEISSVLRTLLTEYPVRRCQTDKGSEFRNKLVQNLFKEFNITHFSTENETIKASIVERWNRTLQTMLHRWFTATGKQRYIDILNDILSSYNNRYHHSIGMSPNEVNTTNQEDVWLRLFSPKEMNTEKAVFKPKDYVRISKARSIFERGFTPNWSFEIFTISKVLSTKPVTYKLVDWDNEPIDGSFYKHELQRVAEPSDFKIEKIIKSKTRDGKLQHFVKWMGYPSKFNQWISDDEISDVA